MSCLIVQAQQGLVAATHKHSCQPGVYKSKGNCRTITGTPATVNCSTLRHSLEYQTPKQLGKQLNLMQAQQQGFEPVEEFVTCCTAAQSLLTWLCWSQQTGGLFIKAELFGQRLGCSYKKGGCSATATATETASHQ